MVQSTDSSARLASKVERTKSPRLSILRKFRNKSFSETDSQRSDSNDNSYAPTLSPSSSPQSSSISGVRRPLSDELISNEFHALHDSILVHVEKFYSDKPIDEVVSQAVIEHASTGITIPWPQVLSLLGDGHTRLATLALCVAWTILSRTLLLKLGISNSPGSTFLPPELVECFQSFCLGKGAVMLGRTDHNAVNFALLSRWKQISATLLHNTYVADAFSHFDARTANIERALKDLDPLLATYANSHDAGRGKGARLEDLREVLRTGAKFAFLLFSQPCYWKFEWASDRAAEHGKVEPQLEPHRAASIGGGSLEDAATKLTPTEIVVWPRLRRVMDEDGNQLEGDGEGFVLGKKKYLNDFENM